MSEATDPRDGGHLIACRSCGHRIARTVRRCPACGLRDPAGVMPEPSPAEEGPARRAGGSGVRVAMGVIAGMLAGAAVTAGIFLLRPPAPVTPAPAVVAPVAPAPASEPSRPAAEPEASRSRGRTDWLFFFKTGDRLVRMSDEAPVGMVLRTEKVHAFADGTAGPAYLVQLPDGSGQRFVDADELERGARLE